MPRTTAFELPPPPVTHRAGSDCFSARPRVTSGRGCERIAGEVGVVGRGQRRKHEGSTLPPTVSVGQRPMGRSIRHGSPIRISPSGLSLL